MASTDTLDDVASFAKLHEANFPILSDASKSASKAFGVLSPMGYAKRWTFYIDSNGIIRDIDRHVKTATAGPDMAENLERLGFE